MSDEEDKLVAEAKAKLSEAELKDTDAVMIRKRPRK